MNIVVTITGSAAVQAKLRKLGSSLYDLKASMADIGRDAADYYANQGFGSQGGVFGQSWRPLSVRYAAKKAGTYPGRPPLIATGKMKNSFTYSSTPSSVLVSNTAPQFKYHQSSAPRSKIPRRVMMGVNEPVKRIVRETIQAEITRKIRVA